MAKRVFKVIDGIAIEIWRPSDESTAHKKYPISKIAHYRAIQRDHDETNIVSDILPWEYNVSVNH